MTGTVVHWFRKGLRLHDNPALCNAINEAENNGFALRPIYVLDPDFDIYERIGNNRKRFLKESLYVLSENLNIINCRLYVLRGKPNIVFERIIKAWNVKCITYEIDIEPYIKNMTEDIENLASKHNIMTISRVSHTLYDLQSTINKNNGKVPLTYQKFLSLVEDSKVKEPVDNMKRISETCKPHPDLLETKSPDCYDTPSFMEMKVDITKLTENLYPGGETEGLRRMYHYLAKEEWVCKFEKPNTSPNSIEPSTTVLSPYLKFGCLSSRLLYHKLKSVENRHSHSKPPVSLLGQLFWREYYYTAAAGTPNFDKMVGNPICIQIPWQKDEAKLKAWSEGKTGYPFVDAIMRQLIQEGWIHHLARHMVACFLTRGDLWVSWEDGMKVFEEYLLDADWALNAGNWMWLSASAFFYKYFRVYSPVAFGKKTDKAGLYIRKYVPELKKYPTEFIYEPWLAPKSIQETAGCIIGKDYPQRIVIHEKISKENLTKMSKAYKTNKELKTMKRPHS